MTQYASGDGYFGFGAEGGVGTEFKLGDNQVQGCFLDTPANASTINTGTPEHEFHVNITPGVIVLGGTKKHFNAQADVDVSKDAAASPVVDTQTIYITVVAYKGINADINLVYLPGTAAVHASAVPLTPAEVDAALGGNAVWMALGHIAFKCTGATTIGQTNDSTARPMGVPDLT